MPRRVNVVESVKRYITGNGEGVMKKITVIVLRELVNGSRTTSELHVKVVSELRQPVKISLVRYVLRRLEKKGVVKSENLLFTKSLLWSLNLDKKELAELQKLLEKTSSPRSS
jgi:predicted transcriptional regulator